MTFLRNGGGTGAADFGGQPVVFTKLNLAGQPFWRLEGNATTDYQYDGAGRLSYVEYRVPGYHTFGSDGLAQITYDYANAAPGTVNVTIAKSSSSFPIPDSLGLAPEVSAPAPPGWLSRQWIGATTVAAAGVAAATRGVEVFVNNAAQTVYTHAYQTWTHAADTITWAADAANQGALYVGGQVVQATEAAAEAFVQKVGEWGGSLVELVGEVRQFAAAGAGNVNQILADFVSDPASFATKLFGAVEKGFNDFLNTQHLIDKAEDAVLKWAFGTLNLSDLLPLPNFASPESVAPWLVGKVFGLNWEAVQGILVSKVGGGNVALAVRVLQEIQDQVATDSSQTLTKLFAWAEGLEPAKLAEEAAEAAAKEAAKVVAPLILAEAVKAFSTGGVATALTAVYNGVTWLIDNANHLEGMAQLMGTIVGRVHGVVTGGEAEKNALAADVTAFLDASVAPVLTFALNQIPGLNALPRTLKNAAEKVRGTPLKWIDKAAEKTVGTATTWLNANGGAGGTQGWAGAPALVKVGQTTYKLWAKSDGKGGIRVMRAIDGKPETEAEFDMKRDAQNLSQADQTALRDRLATVVTLAKASLAAADAAKKAAPTLPNGKPSGPVSPHVTALRQALTNLMTELQADLQTLVDKEAACFFGQACFAAGTPLRTPGGSSPIEALKVGDLVLARSEHDPHGPVEAKAIEEVFRRLASVWEVRVGGRVIGTTGERPFYAWNKGWVACRELAVGDTLLTEGGAWAAVEGVRDTGRWQTVYNLRVADHHTYFVGNEPGGEAVWAHNVYLYRGDNAPYFGENLMGDRNPHIDGGGNLAPASLTGVTPSGHHVTQYDHELGSYRRECKRHSSFISFSETNQIAEWRGNYVIKINVTALEDAINAGHVVGVEAYGTAEPVALFQQEADTNFRDRAICFATKNREVMIRVTIPNQYIVRARNQ